jgi:hypothetical protein
MRLVPVRWVRIIPCHYGMALLALKHPKILQIHFNGQVPRPDGERQFDRFLRRLKKCK